MAWSKDELRKIANADDLHISPFREDGVTFGTPTWIWSVAVDQALYVRAYNGQNSRWWNETKEKIVLFAWGWKRPRSETLPVALA